MTRHLDHAPDVPKVEAAMQYARSAVADGLGRFVLPINQTARLDGEGFLLVPTDGVWWFDSCSRPRPVGDLAESPASYVLLAAGGVGKTVAFEVLAGTEENARYIDLATVDRRELKEALRAAIAAGSPVYLDALDQAAVYDPSLFRVLEQLLTAPSAHRNAWRLACRPAAWNGPLARALTLHLPQFEELKLLAMDKVAAQDAVTNAGFDGPAFIEALVRANLGRLSASPQRLLATARHWQTKGVLPESHREAIALEVDELLAETDDHRRRRLPADRAVSVAKRLGAITTFTDVRSITMAPVGDGHSASVVDLPSDPEPDAPDVMVEPDDYREVLSTALFDAGPPNGLAFRHQQYAEYLAAAYLVDRGIVAEQLPAVLGVHSNGVLPGPRVGVAAWLAALQPALTAGLIADNALAFLQAAVELPTGEARAAVVSGLLAQAARNDLLPEWGLDLSLLAHPGLGGQLASRLEHGPRSSDELWWIAKLAVAGKCHRLAPLLGQHALDSAWTVRARRATVHAVGELGDDDARRALQDLLPLDPSTDPNDELLAALIDTLYPDILTTDELLPVLRPRQSPTLWGGYEQTLQQLAERIPLDDLPAFLNWCASQPNGTDTSKRYGQLFTELVRRAWAQAGTVVVRTALAGLLASDARAGRWLLHQSRTEKPPWVHSDTQLRRALAVDVAHSMNPTSWYTLLSLSLLTADDVAWLIDQLPSVPPRAGTVLGTCLPHLIHEPSAELASRILGLHPSHPAYAATEGLRQPVDLNSPPAVHWREHHAAELEYRQQQAVSREQRLASLAAVVNRAVTDVHAWWRITFLISFDDNNEANESLFTHDLTRRPGWRLLTTAEQKRVLDLGLSYLQIRQINPGHWESSDGVSPHQVLPDWSGVYLMTTLTRHAPEKVRELEPDVWERWAPAIVAAWNFGDEQDARLRHELLHLAPPQARPHIRQAALDQLDMLTAIGKPLSPHRLYEHLVEELAPEVAQRLAVGRYTNDIAHELLNLLAQHSPAIAVETCRELVRNAEPNLSEQAVRHLAALDPNGTVDDLAAAERSTLEFAEIVRHLRIDALDNAHLAVAGRLLLDAFSYDNDPPWQAGFHPVDPLDGARTARTRLLSQLAELGQTRTFAELRPGRPPIDQTALSMYERTARTREADLALMPPTPKELLELLRHGDSRLVRNDADLQAVVLEQLQQLQHQIIHNGAFRDVWNGTIRPKSEDDISDWIRRWLEVRLTRRLVIDREIQVSRPKQGGIGTRIDLAATTPTATQPPSMARIVIEAKLINNDELMTAMHDQLVQRYLNPLGLQHGIYLIYWLTPNQRPADWASARHADPNDLHETLSDQASKAAPGAVIKPYILDISRPVPVIER